MYYLMLFKSHLWFDINPWLRQVIRLLSILLMDQENKRIWNVTRHYFISYFFIDNIFHNTGTVMVVIMWYLSLQLSVPIATKVVSSNRADGALYSLQHYVFTFVQWLAAGLWFSLGTTVSSTNKTDCHDITEILLKVALNTIVLTLITQYSVSVLGKSKSYSIYFKTFRFYRFI